MMIVNSAITLQSPLLPLHRQICPYSLEKINSILSKLITHLKGVKILWLMH